MGSVGGTPGGRAPSVPVVSRSPTDRVIPVVLLEPALSGTAKEDGR